MIVEGDVRGFYARLGVEIPQWATVEAAVSCFANQDRSKVLLGEPRERRVALLGAAAGGPIAPSGYAAARGDAALAGTEG